MAKQKISNEKIKNGDETGTIKISTNKCKLMHFGHFELVHTMGEIGQIKQTSIHWN